LKNWLQKELELLRAFQETRKFWELEKMLLNYSLLKLSPYNKNLNLRRKYWELLWLEEIGLELSYEKLID
jgi:hypothetical protein